MRYATAEHFMVAEKARLFGDASALARVLSAKSSAEAKAVGREVVGYVDDVWSNARFDAVVRGKMAKFGASADLRAFLLETGGRILVEAAPRDTLWGIGLGRDHPRASDPSGWRGQNLLGFALMQRARQVAAHGLTKRAATLSSSRAKPNEWTSRSSGTSPWATHSEWTAVDTHSQSP